MDKETLPGAENKTQEEVIIDDNQVTNETKEIKPKTRFSDQGEIGERTNDYLQKRALTSPVDSKRNFVDADEVKQFSEISSARASHFYNTDEEDEFYDFDEEFDSEELSLQALKHAQAVRLSLFDPKDDMATEFKTEDASFRVSRLPRLIPPEQEPTSAELLFNLKMFEDVSLDSLDATGSLESVKPSKLTAQQQQQPEDFFEKLGRVPEVTDMASASIHSADFKPRHYTKAVSKIYGQFVDPLTGASLTSIVIEEAKGEDLPETSLGEEEIEEEHTDEMEEFVFEDFDAKFPHDEVKSKPKKVDTEGVEEMLDIFEAATKTEHKTEIPEKIDETKTDAFKATKLVECFLDDLLRCVVHFFEEKEDAQFLRDKMDKRALFHEIENTVKEFLIERSVQSFLNRKIENYYRRKRQLRNILPDRPEVLAQERDKFKEAVENLNRVLGREVYTYNKTTKAIEKLFQEQDEAEKLAEDERQKFHDMVKKTLKRDNMPKLEAVIAKELKHMDTVAEEISKVRAVFISRQHMLGKLKVQLDELENIGNGLRVADYEAIERQTIRLEKKIEEHNADLERFYARFHNTIHTMAHSKIRNEMLISSIRQQIKQLSLLDEEQQKCRHVVFQLKKQRQYIQRTINDLSFQSGLLDKPAILLDYDQTVELCEKKRAHVELLRETLNNVEEKLKRAEAACKTAAKDE